jgi:OOP family OmpA-OmpF porin
MTPTKAEITRYFSLAVLSGAILAGGASSAMAAERQIGTITERLESGFIMQTADGSTVTVALTDRTKVVVENGSGKWPASELVPGLPVKVKGVYDGATLVAREIKFSKADRKLAAAIGAGLVGTNQQVQKNTAELDRHQQALTAQQSELAGHTAMLGQQAARIDETTALAVGTAGMVVNTNARITDLADFQVVETVTIEFRNAQANVAPKYRSQLVEFANRAKGVQGYIVQVQGYASAVGSRAFNNDLSQRRAEAVTEILQQQGGIPPTKLSVPAAMGITNPVGDNHTGTGRAENRRVVVTLLQNKGIAQK